MQEGGLVLHSHKKECRANLSLEFLRVCIYELARRGNAQCLHIQLIGEQKCSGMGRGWNLEFIDQNL